MNHDAELLRRYVDDRSEAAFAELVQRHLSLVYYAALRRTGGDTHLAEDVAQGVFTALAREAGSLRAHPALTGWLYTTTRRVAAKAVRTEHRRQTREQAAHLMSELAQGTGTAADWERLRPVLDAALDELNDRDREAVLWRCWEGRAYADIGAALRVTEDAARMRVDRALDRLRDGLAKRGLTSTSAALAAALASQAALAAPAGLAASIASGALAGASAVTGGVAVKVLSFMSTTKIMVGVAGLIAVAATTIAVRQQQTNEELRTQLATLRADAVAATTTLRTENQRLVATRTGEQTAATAAAEHEELMKMRAEKAAYLKAAAAKAAAIRAAAEAAGGHVPTEKPQLGPGMLPVEAMADVGRASPSAAAQTMLWALQRGDVKDAAAVLAFEPADRAKLEAFIATLPEKFRQDYSTPEQVMAFVMSGSPRPIAGVQLLNTTQPDATTEVHHVQVQYQNGEVKQDDVTFKKDPDGWKQLVATPTVDRVIAYFKGKQ